MQTVRKKVEGNKYCYKYEDASLLVRETVDWLCLCLILASVLILFESFANIFVCLIKIIRAMPMHDQSSVTFIISEINFLGMNIPKNFLLVLVKIKDSLRLWPDFTSIVSCRSVKESKIHVHLCW